MGYRSSEIVNPFPFVGVLQYQDAVRVGRMQQTTVVRVPQEATRRRATDSGTVIQLPSTVRRSAAIFFSESFCLTVDSK